MQAETGREHTVTVVSSTLHWSCDPLSLAHAHTHRAYLSQDEVLRPMLNPLYEKNSSVLLLTVHALNVVRIQLVAIASGYDFTIPLHNISTLIRTHTHTHATHTYMAALQTLWKRLYLRMDIEPSLSLPGYEATCKLKETNTQLKRTLNQVRRCVAGCGDNGREPRNQPVHSHCSKSSSQDHLLSTAITSVVCKRIKVLLN